MSVSEVLSKYVPVYGPYMLPHIRFTIWASSDCEYRQSSGSYGEHLFSGAMVNPCHVSAVPSVAKTVGTAVGVLVGSRVAVGTVGGAAGDGVDVGIGTGDGDGVPVVP